MINTWGWVEAVVMMSFRVLFMWHIWSNCRLPCMFCAVLYCMLLGLTRWSASKRLQRGNKELQELGFLMQPNDMMGGSQQKSLVFVWSWYATDNIHFKDNRDGLLTGDRIKTLQIGPWEGRLSFVLWMGIFNRLCVTDPLESNVVNMMNYWVK